MRRMLGIKLEMRAGGWNAIKRLVVFDVMSNLDAYYAVIEDIYCRQLPISRFLIRNQVNCVLRPLREQIWDDYE